MSGRLEHKRPRLRCREITTNDLSNVATLLAKAFTSETDQLRQLRRLAERDIPDQFPRFGYLLEHDGNIVGAILTIFSVMSVGSVPTIRCNFSSWYVEPDYKSYGPLLVSQALKHKDVTYLNVSARPATWQLVMAQGFKRYSDGIFVAVPLLTRPAPSTRAVIIDRANPHNAHLGSMLDPGEQKILSDHAGFGCIAIVCESQGEAHPFVFARRALKGFVPCVHLVYCRSIDEFTRFSGNIGRLLAKRGIPFATVDANRPVDKLIGRHYPEKMPKFSRGDAIVRPGDLAYTNIAMLENT